MKNTYLFLIFVFLVLFVTPVFFTGYAVMGQGEPVRPLGLVLTWQQDPTSTMTIDWHTTASGVPSVLEYKEVEREEDWRAIRSKTHSFPYSDRLVHRVELTGLQPDTEYWFRFAEDSPPRKFRTMPVDAHRPIRIAIGGDVRHEIYWMERTNRRAASYDPDFIVWGGDLAYADGLESRLYRWYEYLESMMNSLVTEDGRVIPVLAGIGNHEVLGGYYHRDGHDRREGIPPYTQDDESRERLAPYYFSLFAFPGQPGYGVLDFGEYLSIILLDTDHVNPIEGEQTEWLEKVLAEREHVPHVFPNYHVPAYPSARSMHGRTQTLVRETWVPLFEKYGIRVAFENHDHLYKRTYPIRNGKIAHDGIVYIGDGAWGVRTRDVGRDHDDEHAWYLKRAGSERHFILATLHGPHHHFLMVNEHGEIIDEYPRTTNFDLGAQRFLELWKPVDAGME